MENGNYVTRAELAAHIAPMKEDIGELVQDVKALLFAQAQADAKLVEEKKRHNWFVVKLTVVATVVSGGFSGSIVALLHL